MQDFYQDKKLPKNDICFNIKQGDGKYIPSDDLQKAVNVALLLNKPLLITGLPGTGKTDLAFHIANRFSLGEPLVFHTKTTSVANDMLYQYNSLAHFQQSQKKDSKILEPTKLNTNL